MPYAIQDEYSGYYKSAIGGGSWGTLLGGSCEIYSFKTKKDRNQWVSKKPDVRTASSGNDYVKDPGEHRLVQIKNASKTELIQCPHCGNFGTRSTYYNGKCQDCGGKVKVR